MRYAIMIASLPGANDGLSEAEFEVIVRDYAALAADPRTISRAQLQPVETATSVRVVDGKTLVTDGPFADTKEVLGGVAFIEADNLDEVIEIVARIPAARMGGVVEIRPVVEN